MTRPDAEPGAVARLRAALCHEPAGIVTDYDGTLAPIVDDPARAAPAPGASELLADLARRLTVVAVVTGRAARDARGFVGTDELLVVGNHGLEWLERGEAEPRPTPELDRARGEIEQALARLRDVAPGVVLEAKGLSATAHYRAAPHPEAARRAILRAIEATAHPALEVREGKMSVELRPAAAGDKGTALVRIVERHALRGLAVLGDDLTDLDMFRAAAGLRDAGRIEACIGAVGVPGEMPPAVEAAADLTIPDPDALVALLRRAVS